MRDASWAPSCVLKYDEFVLWADPDRYGGPAHGSHLHTLELFACVFDTRGLAALLGRTPALRKLHLAQQGKMGLFNVVGVVGSAVEAAQRCVGKTLEELSFTMMEPFPAVEATPVVGMGGFERLRVLEMDLSMLTGLADDSEPALPSDTDLGDGGDRARCRPGELATPRLVDVLPRAIETVSLLYRPTSAPQQDAQHIRRLFDGLAGERGAKLPNLNTVTILAPHLRRLSPEVAEALQETQHQGCSLLLRRNPCFEFVATFRERFGLPDEEMENGSPDYLPPVNRYQADFPVVLQLFMWLPRRRSAKRDAS
ncbi:hypothetical protein VTK73DRAFT_9020 [Phialemonium thermophilum]|uniref:Uncharacterized protein n=1 Tax=Phialemonium thermophilum TaxID=223376 RepID=A0ABR3W522_9PEZI